VPLTDPDQLANNQGTRPRNSFHTRKYGAIR